MEWRAAHPDIATGDLPTEEVLDRVVDAYHAARQSFADRAPVLQEATA
jgi:hypothetical protein